MKSGRHGIGQVQFEISGKEQAIRIQLDELRIAIGAITLVLIITCLLALAFFTAAFARFFRFATGAFAGIGDAKQRGETFAFAITEQMMYAHAR